MALDARGVGHDIGFVLLDLTAAGAKCAGRPSADAFGALANIGVSFSASLLGQYLDRIVPCHHGLVRFCAEHP